MPEKNRFVIRHGDTYLYYLTPRDLHDTGYTSRAENVAVSADGQPMERLSTSGYDGWWFAADHRATLITREEPAKKVPVEYVLKDPAMESARYPGRLSVEEYRAGANLYEVYESVDREDPPAQVPIATDTGDWILIDGTPPPPAAEGQPAWTPDLFEGLTNRPEYHHLLPGRIHGLRSALYKRIEHMVGSFRCSLDPKGQRPGVSVRLQIPFEKPVSYWESDTSWSTGKKLKRGKTVQSTVTREMLLPIPNDVVGATYAEALVAWGEAVEYWLDVVRKSAGSQARACNHCGGHGFVGGDVFSEYDVAKGVFGA